MHDVLLGDCLEVMKTFPANHFTGIVTDPPYGLRFMNAEWDHAVPGIEFWKEALRISKPGSFLLCFGGSRTYHRITCAIEDAGWEIRDCIMWIYGSGFPKSKGCLKPAYEPIILARKKGSNPKLNIDECRLETRAKPLNDLRKERKGSFFSFLKPKNYDSSKGRWPANIILDEENENLFGDRSRFFYCAKASSLERNAGCRELPDKSGGGLNSTVNGDSRTGHLTIQKNNHPTVKPLKLMEYLITLISPKTETIILDPFAGSGSTLVACKKLGIPCIGIEKEEKYIKISKERIKAA